MKTVGDITLECAGCGPVAPHLEERNGQIVACCPRCAAYIKCVPRSELGLESRSVTSRPGIKPKARARVLDRFGYACVTCGRLAGDVVLHVDHLIPVELAKRYNVYDDLIESEWNLAPECEECNLGKGASLFSARTVALMRRGIMIASKAPTE